MIPYGRQSISESDVESVVAVLKSDWLTQGPTVTKFENIISDMTGAKYCVAVSNATAALHIACLALDVGVGDIVWTSPNSFVASANCALYCGADVDFVDIDKATYNMCPEKLEKKLIQAKTQGKLPKVVIPVHFSGQSCDMKKIAELAKTYNFKVIEDASHAIGGKYAGKFVGNCDYSDITVFSFHPVKIVTTGEGGALTCKSESLFKKLSLLRTHGITRDTDRMSMKSPGEWYYEQVDLGFNYRITDLQCALGISQFARLHDFIARRNELAANYDKLLKDVDVIRPVVTGDCLSAWHLYVVQVKNRDEVYRKMKAGGIGVNVHYYPIYRQPYYKKFNFEYESFPINESYAHSTITLPLFFDLTMDQQMKVVEELKKAL